MRTQYLKSQGITVLRFWDNEVLKNTKQVLQSILNAIENPTLTPTPLPAGEGLKGEATCTSTPLPAGEGLKGEATCTPTPLPAGEGLKGEAT